MRKILIHVHIPKCGGSSFVEALKHKHGKGFKTTNSILNDYQYNARQIEKIIKHYPSCTCLSGHKLSLHLPYNSQEFSLFVISLIRDPVDRFLSHYFYHRQQKNACWVPQTKNMKLEEYIQWALEAENQPAYIDGQVKFLSGMSGEKGYQWIRTYSDKENVLLLPLEKYDQALNMLHRHYPDYFDQNETLQINKSYKDQPIPEELMKRIRCYEKWDTLLHSDSMKKLSKINTL